MTAFPNHRSLPTILGTLLPPIVELDDTGLPQKESCRLPNPPIVSFRDWREDRVCHSLSFRGKPPKMQKKKKEKKRFPFGFPCKPREKATNPIRGNLAPAVLAPRFVQVPQNRAAEAAGVQLPGPETTLWWTSTPRKWLFLLTPSVCSFLLDRTKKPSNFCSIAPCAAPSLAPTKHIRVKCTWSNNCPFEGTPCQLAERRVPVWRRSSQDPPVEELQRHLRKLGHPAANVEALGVATLGSVHLGSAQFLSKTLEVVGDLLENRWASLVNVKKKTDAFGQWLKPTKKPMPATSHQSWSPAQAF